MTVACVALLAGDIKTPTTMKRPFRRSYRRAHTAAPTSCEVPPAHHNGRAEHDLTRPAIFPSSAGLTNTVMTATLSS